MVPRMRTSSAEATDVKPIRAKPAAAIVRCIVINMVILLDFGGCRQKLGATRRLFPEMFVEEARDLFEGILGLRRGVIAIELRMRLALEDLQRSLDTGLTQLAMNPHGVAEQQVARAACEDGRRETVHVAIDRRQQRIPQVAAGG